MDFLDFSKSSPENQKEKFLGLFSRIFINLELNLFRNTVNNGSFQIFIRYDLEFFRLED